MISPARTRIVASARGFVSLALLVLLVLITPLGGPVI
jgi:hypothetical protein